MRKKNGLMVVLGILAALLTFAGFLTIVRQTRAEALMEGVRQLRKKQCDMVQLSTRVTRILTRNDDRSELLIRSQMRSTGWDYVCHYGRSGLYRKNGLEVLVRKTPFVGNYCIYELLDENYFKYMRSEIRETA